MQRFRDSILSNSSSGLLPLANATVTVYLAGTSTPALTFSDNGDTPKPNPFQSDSLGVIDFYAPDGRYDLYVRHSDYSPAWVRDVQLNDPSDDGVATTNSDTVTFSGSGAQATPLAATAKVSATPGNQLTVDDDGLYVPGSASGIPEAPVDGEVYGRGDEAWQQLSAVAKSGEYSDLANKPTIPAAPVNADWNAEAGLAQIKNKPTIPAAQTWPGEGVAISTGTAWGTSKSAPTGDLVGTTDAQTLTNKTIGASSKESVTTGAAIAISDASAPFQHITLAAPATATVSLSAGASRTLWVNPVTFTITWPPNVQWAGGSAPELTASKWTLIEFVGTPVIGEVFVARVGELA